MMQYMKAALLARTKEVRDDGAIVEVVIWQLQEPLAPCLHDFKYRLYYGCAGVDRVRFDNERGKGDHRHVGSSELPYAFDGVDRLIDDFIEEVERWKREH